MMPVHDSIVMNGNTHKKKKKKKGLSKKVINIIRTTQRNNIDLTAIADNKANVLLSLNALMIAALLPLVISNVDLVIDTLLFVPLIILASTCFTTIYMAAQVLKPSDFDDPRVQVIPDAKKSPFFFGNFYEMDAKEYYTYIKSAIAKPELVRAHLAQDLYYIGRRLGKKMSFVRIAYNIFIVGILLTLLSTALVLSWT